MSTEQIKPGYKRTEVGVIPEAWSSKSVRELGSVVTGGTPATDIRHYWGGQHPWITPTDIDGARDMCESHRMLTDSGLRAIRALPPNTVLVTCIASIGKNAILRKIGGCNQQINALIPNEKHNADYLYYMFEAGKGHLLANAGTTATSIVSKATFESLEFPIPTLNEQRAIATALSDVDALLTKLDQLIAKKRDIKQAAMQQLLTGQTRLPGFSGHWEETTFDQVVRHHSGNSSLIKGKLSEAHAFDLFPAYSASGQNVWCDHYEHEGDAVVVSAVGSRCGKAFLASGKWTAIANTHVIWPKEDKINRHFLGFFVNNEDFWLKSGSGQPFVLFRQTLARKLKLPSLLEQEAIAIAISNINAELATLEARRNKTFLLKQGMMHELLTGRIRLT